MKNLFAVLLTVVFAATQMTACTDSDKTVAESPAADAAQTLDVVSTEDIVSDGLDGVDAQTTEEVTSETDSVENSSDVTVTEVDEPEQLPSDPTDDPDQESSYYEFPAWHIPSPSES